MNYKPLLILLGEPYSVFIELFLKTYKKYILKNKIKIPIILVGSYKLFEKQMKYFNYNFDINLINERSINKVKNNKKINIINVNHKFKKIFEKKSSYSNDYIKNTFRVSLKLLQKNKACGLINGPISKKKFLKKRYLGITEYLTSLTNTKETSMLIFNKELSVCPITTHLPINKVANNLTKKKICASVIRLNDFYINKLKIKPKIAILGLNPHCESNSFISEEDKIIRPALKYLKLKKINISGLFSADTFFLKENYKKYNLVIGMYHDQVLTPAKTLFNFDAINITVGLPFIRISPDHGPNENMVSKNVSNPLSLIKSIDFFKRINAS